MKNNEVLRVIENINTNIQRCSILKRLLKDKETNDSVDYNWYYENGYEDEEIRVGEELVDMYIILKDYIHGHLPESKLH